MSDNNESNAVAPTPETEVAGSEQPSKDAINLSLLAHLLIIVSGFIGPLIIWLIKKDEGGYLEAQSKEALNFSLTLVIAWIGCVILSFVAIGFLLFPILFLIAFIMPIIAAVKVSKGESYQYPVALRLLN